MNVLANKAMTSKEKLVELIGLQEDPSISIILKKGHKAARDEKIQILLKNSIKDAVNKLKEANYDKRLIEDLKEKLEKIETKVIYEDAGNSVVIFLSPNREEIIWLPFDVENKVIVDNTFEIRDLLRTINRSFQYDVIVLSKKKTKFYNGYQNKLQQIETEDIPEGVEYYLNNRISNKEDPGKAEMEALKLYVNDVDDFIRLYTDMHTPLIVMGDEKIVSYFKNKTRRPDKILAEIYGSYDDERTSVISNKINEKLDEYIKIRDKQLLERIQPDIDRLSYVSGIQEAWTVAAMKEARIMLIEQGYSEEGYSIKNGLFLVFSEPVEEKEYDYHSDALDDLTEMVLMQGGEVYFVSPGLLDKYDKIVVTTRF